MVQFKRKHRNLFQNINYSLKAQSMMEGVKGRGSKRITKMNHVKGKT